jgi:hypothetical protein
MALRLPLMGLRKAKALSREGDAGSVQKMQRIKKPRFCHVSLKHETALAKNVIWSSTMSRSRRKGAILRERFALPISTTADHSSYRARVSLRGKS